MGLQDRDYMRPRGRKNLQGASWTRESPFAPPPETRSFLPQMLAFVAGAFLLFKAFAWWEDARQQRAKPRRPAMQQVQRENAAVPVSPERPRSDAPARFASPAPQPRTHESAQPAEPVIAPAPESSGTIYFCRAYNGGSFWASDHCNRHNALIDRIVSVPSGMPFQQQVQIAEQRSQALAVPAPGPAAPTPPIAVMSNKAVCDSLDQHVTALDAMARQPQSGQMQDWIRSERQKTRDQQFRLHC